MKWRPFFSILLLVITGVSSARADIAWETDYNEATLRSRATGKPLFIDFYTDWCGWCKKLDSNVYPDARIQQMAGSFVMLRLDAEGAGAPVAKAFRVTGYPTLVFASAQGQTLNITPGYMGADDFARTMKSVLAATGGPKTSRPAPKTASQTATGQLQPTLQRLKITQNASNWRAMPEMQGVKKNDGYSGAYLLDENGAVPLDAPAKKVGKKMVKKPAKSVKPHAAAR